MMKIQSRWMRLSAFTFTSLIGYSHQLSFSPPVPYMSIETRLAIRLQVLFPTWAFIILFVALVLFAFAADFHRRIVESALIHGNLDALSAELWGQTTLTGTELDLDSSRHYILTRRSLCAG